ncbi:MAG: ABC transporter substrate-binding protein [Acidimicrobiales bacterium]
MTAPARGWVGWVSQNRAVSAGLAASLALAGTGIGVAASRAGGGASARSPRAGAGEVVQAGGESPAGPGSGPVQDSKPVPTGAAGTPAGHGGVVAGSVAGRRVPVVGTGGPAGAALQPGPGGGGTVASGCIRAPDHETGVTDTSVTIGQIISDVAVIPAQMRPSYEGLQAYVKVVNDAGGVCGRKIKIQFSNDNANPANHDYVQMTHQVFAFVANGSLVDSADYQSDAPFNPTATDHGEYVPDVGGLATTYSRAQSPWYASPLGSVAPTLTGGASYRYLVQEAAGRVPDVPASAHGRCRKAGIAYLKEPSGIDEDQARLGGAALAADWGAGLGASNVSYYVSGLAEPVPAYEAEIAQMVDDGVNCVFGYSDLQSDINLIQAAANQGVWPPDRCTGSRCFSVIALGFGAYDRKLIRDGGDAARFVSIYSLPFVPLTDVANPDLAHYLTALRAIPGATPSAYSMIGFASGAMFVQALSACGGAPTRACVMSYLRGLKDYSAAGLIPPVTPLRSTRVRCAGDCGSFSGHGTYDWRWFNPCQATVRVLDRPAGRDFYRVTPKTGFACGPPHVARGTPA